jgi:hypothetical protein
MNIDIDFIIPSDFIKYSLEAQINNEDNWKELYSYRLMTPEKNHLTMYQQILAYDNI